MRHARLLSAILIVFLYGPGTVDAQCAGDFNDDGAVTIDELVRAVHGALFGCSDVEPDPVQILLSTDKVRYVTGDELRATIRLYSTPNTAWWAEFPLVPTFEPCIFNIRLSRGHFFEEEVVYDSTQTELTRGCGFYDGGPARVKGVREIPPVYQLERTIPLVGNVGERAGKPLEPGIYLVDGILALGLIPEGSNPLIAPNSPRQRAAVQVEIQSSEVPSVATPTPTPVPGGLTYLLSGTLNSRSATGRMVMVPVNAPQPNLLLYDVISFEFGDLRGTGDLEFFTISNTYTLRLALRDSEQREFQASGTAPLASNVPRLPGEFTVSGDGQTMIFTVERLSAADIGASEESSEWWSSSETENVP